MSTDTSRTPHESLFLAAAKLPGSGSGLVAMCPCGDRMPAQPEPFSRDRWACASCDRGFCVDCHAGVGTDGRCVFGRGRFPSYGPAADERVAA
jgi:hypothetical protein